LGKNSYYKKKRVTVSKDFLNLISKLTLPTYIFRGNNLTALEAIVKYLREEEKLSYNEIALVLDRDERNIWTVYNRVKKKNG